MIRFLVPLLALANPLIAEEKPRAEFWLDLHMAEPIEPPPSYADR